MEMLRACLLANDAPRWGAQDYRRPPDLRWTHVRGRNSQICGIQDRNPICK